MQYPSSIMGQLIPHGAKELFSIGSHSITISMVALAVAYVVFSYVISKVVAILVRSTLVRRGVELEVARPLARLVAFLLFFIGCLVGLESTGFDLTALFAASAALAVGLGLALKSLAENFVSGIILLMEHSIVPGDVLVINGETLLLKDVRLRSSLAEVRDGSEVVIPNSLLIQQAVQNKTLEHNYARMTVTVGVHYDSDMKTVFETLNQTIEKFQERWPKAPYKPAVLLMNFGDSSVNWRVSAWGDDAWKAVDYEAELRLVVWNALKANGITIAYPQLDVHFHTEEKNQGSLAGPAHH